MKDLTALYEHLQSAYDEAYEQELWQLALKIGEIQSMILEFRAKTKDEKQPLVKD